LWHFNTGQAMHASPMTYAVNGIQYVAIAAGSDVFAFTRPSGNDPSPTSRHFPNSLSADDEIHTVEARRNGDAETPHIQRVLSIQATPPL
jgi:hypothetical protein